jgi:phytanoyl-CoA hydroxylase
MVFYLLAYFSTLERCGNGERTDSVVGQQLGKDFETDFTANAKAAGLTDEQAKSAFNQNMMSTGLLAEGPAEFGRTHKRRWLVTDYEAGDVVLHSPYTVCG